MNSEAFPGKQLDIFEAPPQAPVNMIDTIRNQYGGFTQYREEDIRLAVDAFNKDFDGQYYASYTRSNYPDSNGRYAYHFHHEKLDQTKN